MSNPLGKPIKNTTDRKTRQQHLRARPRLPPPCIAVTFCPASRPLCCICSTVCSASTLFPLFCGGTIYFWLPPHAHSRCRSLKRPELKLEAAQERTHNHNKCRNKREEIIICACAAELVQSPPSWEKIHRLQTHFILFLHVYMFLIKIF